MSESTSDARRPAGGTAATARPPVARQRARRRRLASLGGPAAWMLGTIAVLSLLLGKPADAALVTALLAANAWLGFVQRDRARARPALHVAGSVARISRRLAWTIGAIVAFVFVLAGFQGHPWIETARLALVLLTSAVTVGVPAMLAVSTNLAPLMEGQRIAYQRVLTWVLNKISRTLLKTGFVAIAFVATGRFVVSAFTMLLLVSMADFMKLSLAAEPVAPSPRAQSWSIAPYARVAAVIAGLMLMEALAALAFGWRRYGLAREPARLYTFSFLVLLDFGAWSLVSLRERRWFGATRPSRTLALAIAAELLFGPVVTQAGVSDLRAAPLEEALAILGYSAACCLFVNDAVKVWFVRRLHAAAA